MRKLHEAREAKVSELLRDNARLRTAQTSGEAYVNRCQAQLVSLVQSSGTGGFGSRPDEANLFYAKFLESRVEELRSQLQSRVRLTIPTRRRRRRRRVWAADEPGDGGRPGEGIPPGGSGGCSRAGMGDPPWPRDYATPPRRRNTGLGAP